MNESVNDEAVCRTAPATLGLLKKVVKETQVFLDCSHVIVRVPYGNNQSH